MENNHENTLRVSEIFYSLQGETSRVGLPTVFIRLTGCPLRCYYCDATHAFKGGERLSIEAILKEISQYNTRFITVSGGEPLAQPLCFNLLKALSDANYEVSLETSGALDIQKVDSRVLIIMDLKTPESQEVEKNLYKNIDYLKPQDEIKFVVNSQKDFDWACAIIQDYELEKRCHILFSPVWNIVSPGELGDWLLKSQIKARLQIQLHKILWGDNTRR